VHGFDEKEGEMFRLGGNGELVGLALVSPRRNRGDQSIHIERKEIAARLTGCSGGIEGRPTSEYIASNRTVRDVCARSVIRRMARRGWFGGTRLSGRT
jgi:hypothetical protein